MFRLLIFLFIITTSSGNYYDLLGISKGADDRQIRMAFKKLVVALHPDKNKDPDANEKFLKVTKAYEVLKNEETRKNYDLYGEEKVPTSKPQYHSWSYYTENFGIYDDDLNIVTLNRHTFDQSVKNSKTMWFINYYSPMCSHCHHLAPEWRLLATYLQNVIHIGAVNCEDDWVLCREEQIHSYPSLVLYPAGEIFNGNRVKDDLVNFVLERLENIVYELSQSDWSRQIKHENNDWLLIMCKDDDVDCLSDEKQTLLSAMLEGLAKVGNINCNEQTSFCDNFDTTEQIIFVQNPRNNMKKIVIHELGIREIFNKVLDSLPATVELDPTELEDTRTRLTLGSTTSWLIYFYMGDGFIHEIELKKLRPLLGNVQLGKFNCARYSQVCNQLYIQRYPVLLMLKTRGGIEMYHGKIISDDVANFAAESASSTNCRSLTPDDFPNVLQEQDHGLWIVDFYAPWCPPCMRLLPEFRKASRFLDVVSFGTVDCTIHTRLCQSYNIRSYPTTMFYNKSESQQYHGDYKSSEIVDFLEDMITPLVQNLNHDNFYQLVGRKPETDLWIIDYFMPWCQPCQILGPQWRKLAKMIRDIPNVYIGQVNCETENGLCNQQAIKSYPTIRLYPYGGVGLSTVAIYSNYQRDANTIKHWLYSFLPSAVVTLTPDNFVDMVIKSKTPWLVDFYTPWCGHCVSFEPEFQAVARQLEKDVSCGKVDCQQYETLCRHVGVKQYPTVLLYRGTKLDPWQNEEYRGEELHDYRAESLIYSVRTLLREVHDEL